MARKTFLILSALAAALTVALAPIAVSAIECGPCEIDDGTGVCTPDCVACPDQSACITECNDGFCGSQDCNCPNYGDCPDDGFGCRNDYVEICDDVFGNDEDSNGLANCADTTTGTDGCCADPYCEGNPYCSMGVYGCMDTCANNFDPWATDPSENTCGNGGCCYGDDPVGDGNGAPPEGDCCSDGHDNDVDSFTDSADSDCGGGGSCGASDTYSSSVPCSSGFVKAFAGAASNDIALNSDGSCSARSALAASVAASTPSPLCAAPNGTFHIASGSPGTDYFVYDYTIGSACPAGQRPYGNVCTTCPIGQDPLPGGGCGCAAGDSDGDGICNDADPCDNIADASLTSDGAAAAAGLGGVGGSCFCASYVRDLHPPSDEGSDVAALQSYLVGHGYLTSGVGTRGVFGYAEQDAVYLLQDDYGFAHNFFDQQTREQINNAQGIQANEGVYNSGTHNCEIPPEDLCPTFCHDVPGNSCVETQEWLDANPTYVRDPATGECTVVCGAGMQQCADGTCIPETDCCQPSQFWYCDDSSSMSCIANSKTCPPVDCTTTNTDPHAVFCCQNPLDSSCTHCRSGYRFCPDLQACVPESTYADDCVVGCSGLPADGEYCTVIASATDGNGDGRGDFLKPWRTTDGYSTFAALDAFFGVLCNAGVGSACPTGDLARIFTEQNDARTDGDPGTPVYPIYGKVKKGPAGSGVCEGTPCEHGEECALYVRANGKTSASCVPAVCDPCDPASSCYLTDQAARDAVCNCNPLLQNCCTPGTPGCTPVHGVAIVVLSEASAANPDLPQRNIIDVGESCVVAWSSQGMSSVTVTGDGIDADLAGNFAGKDLVSPIVSTVYKIRGLGTDGVYYEANDLCALNPVIREI